MFNVVILAAGRSTRMHSHKPKMLHNLAGKSLINRILSSLLTMSSTKDAPSSKYTLNKIAIVHNEDNYSSLKYELDSSMINHGLPINPDNIVWALQHKQLGTADAVLCGINHLASHNNSTKSHNNTLSHSSNTIFNQGLLILCADTPLISQNTLSNLIYSVMDQAYNNNCECAGLVTTCINNPYGYGRIIQMIDGRNNQDQASVQNANNRQKIQNINTSNYTICHGMIKIVEEKDAEEKEKLVNEINSGIYFFSHIQTILSLIQYINNNNQAQELYFTDLIGIASQNDIAVLRYQLNQEEQYQIHGVNTQLQLHDLERYYQTQLAEALILQGLRIVDKTRFDYRSQNYIADKYFIKGNISHSIEFGYDCIIEVNCILEGQITLGNNVKIGIGCHLKNVNIGDNVTIQDYTIIDHADIASDATIGPFARIRPKTKIDLGAKIGNFVEIKEAEIGMATKINHLSYVGNAIIGKHVNIGAGSVTCNYDGVNKHNTNIKDGAFIGSGCMLIAPITIGENSLIGAGSTITKNTPDNELTLERGIQTTVTGWMKKRKNKHKK